MYGDQPIIWPHWKINRRWEELPSLKRNSFFWIFLCFSPRVNVKSSSIARRRCVNLCVCVRACMCVCVCFLLSWIRAAGFNAPAAGVVLWCNRGRWWTASLTGVHGFHVGGAGVSLDGVKDSRQLLIGWDLRLKLRHERRLLGLGDGQQGHHSPHGRPLQLILLLKLLLYRVGLHLQRGGGWISGKCSCSHEGSLGTVSVSEALPWWCRWPLAAPPACPASAEPRWGTERTAWPAWGTSTSAKKKQKTKQSHSRNCERCPLKCVFRVCVWTLMS